MGQMNLNQKSRVQNVKLFEPSVVIKSDFGVFHIFILEDAQSIKIYTNILKSKTLVFQVFLDPQHGT